MMPLMGQCNLAKAKRISITRLAKAAGLSRVTVSQYFMGNRDLMAENLLSICAALGVDIPKILEARILECITVPSVIPRAKLRSLTSTKTAGHSL
jgi:transcriptional regulator with XRE-family HTH domain